MHGRARLPVPARSTPAAWSATFAAIELVVVDGFDVFTPVLRCLFGRIFELAPESILSFDYDPDRPRLFGHLSDTFTTFAEQAERMERVTETTDDQELPSTVNLPRRIRQKPPHGRQEGFRFILSDRMSAFVEDFQLCSRDPFRDQP